MCSVEIEKLSTVDLQIKNIVQELRQALEALYGARLKRLVFYGSHARGEATDNSDIDVMVVLDGPVRPGEEIRRMGWIRTRLNLKYEQLLSLLPISTDDFQQKDMPLLDDVRQEGIVV